MNTFRSLTFALLAAALAPAARALVDEVVRVFPVQPGCSLTVDTYRGSITIVESDAAEIRVEVEIEPDAETEMEAKRLRAGLELDFKTEGSKVAVTAVNPIETGWRFTWRKKSQLDLSYRISVPRQCHLTLQTGTGSITVGRLSGKMAARVETGTIFFRAVDGSIDAAVETGDIVISRCSGAVTARVRKGVIRAGTIGGPADLKSSHGNIEVLRPDAALTAYAEVGDIIVNFPRHVAHPASVTASGGSIFAKVDPAANCELEASATWGVVQCSLALKPDAGDGGKRKIAGRLNQGGPLLMLRASGGSVKIAPGPTPFE